MIDQPCNAPEPCELKPMSLVGKRIVVMQKGYTGSPYPVAVHDTLDGAVADLGARSARCLVEWNDTERGALYLVAVDR